MGTTIPRLPRISRAKFSSNEWRWDYHPGRGRWETYRLPADWPGDLFKWLHDTFGHPGTDPDTGVYSNWDYHGGWIYLYREEHLTLFNLRWQ